MTSTIWAAGRAFTVGPVLALVLAASPELTTFVTEPRSGTYDEASFEFSDLFVDASRSIGEVQVRIAVDRGFELVFSFEDFNDEKDVPRFYLEYCGKNGDRVDDIGDMIDLLDPKLSEIVELPPMLAGCANLVVANMDPEFDRSTGVYNVVYDLAEPVAVALAA